MVEMVEFVPIYSSTKTRSSGFSSSSDTENDSCELGTGLIYNVRSEGVFTYKGEYKGEERVTNKQLPQQTRHIA